MGRPSYIVDNARWNYDNSQHFTELFEGLDGVNYRRHYLTLAVADSVAIHRSVRAASVAALGVLVFGIAVMGGGLILFITTMHTFAMSQLLILIVIGVAHSVAVLPSLFTDVSPRAPGLRWALAAWLTGLAVMTLTVGIAGILAWRARPTSIGEQLGAGFLLFGLITIVTLLLAALVNRLIRALQRKYLVGWRPEATAIFELLWALDIIGHFGRRPMSNWARWAAVDAIEFGATAVTEGISRQVRISDPYARGVFQRRLQDAADAIRDFEVDLVVCGPQGRSELTERIKGCAKGLLVQQYSDLPVADEARRADRQAVASQAVRARGVKLAKGIVAALVPIGLVQALRFIPVDFPPETIGTLTAIAAGWLFIKALSILDPGYRETLSDARSATSSSGQS